MIVTEPMETEEDRVFVRASRRQMLDGLLSVVEEGFSVNPPRLVEYGCNKLQQLKVAKFCGMKIPPTLITSDYDLLREFCQQHKSIIAKPLMSYVWGNQDHQIIAATTRIASINDIGREEVELAPTIYQAEVEKRIELRVTVFGKYFSAVSIDSQRFEGSSLDWRADRRYLETLEPFDVPSSIQEKILAFMKYTGLRFGTFDFAIEPDGEFVFFEVNVSGQFLWTEARNPDVAVYEPFVRYLIAKSDEFSWDPKNRSDDLRLESVRHHAEQGEIWKYLFDEPSDQAVSRLIFNRTSPQVSVA